MQFDTMDGLHQTVRPLLRWLRIELRATDAMLRAEEALYAIIVAALDTVDKPAILVSDEVGGSRPTSTKPF